MKKLIAPLMLASSAAITLLLPMGSAQAQATRTWVSGVGDDVNPCSRTAPCKTFAGAISKTAVNGEINCLDPGGFGGVTITKSITIDCIWIPGSILNAGFNAVNVSFDSFAGTDVRKSVRLRGINMQGANTGTNGVRITGGATVTGGSVVIEDVVIDGNFAGTGRGITDERQGAGELYVLNTTVRNNLGIGIAVIPSVGTSGVQATIQHSRSLNNTNAGISVQGGAKATVRWSNTSGNGNVGLDAEGAGTQLNVTDSVSSGNANAALFTSGGSAAILSGTDLVAYTGQAANGIWSSFGNNRVSGTAGTAPTPIGAASTDLGQK
jgi:hypothetical protein